MALRSFDLRCVETLVSDVAAQVAFRPNCVYIALVADPPTEQRLVDVRCLLSPALIDSYDEARDEIYELMRSFAIPEAPPPPRHIAVTFVVRPGLCVFGPNEGRWMSAWRYSNHLTNCFDGEMVLVTEHGWAALMSDTGDRSPAMAA